LKKLTSYIFRALTAADIEAFWARKSTQYKSLQSAYVNKQLNAEVSTEVEKYILEGFKKSSFQKSH
jgi:hypothetical protein